ncbi:MAG: hypothetical protein LKE46_13795 [Clostridium sp.]|jgi:hypothetical protein|uniref:hypothetical protein n=1 Tax=Clostridium sp. TaxID=1506 RepID=UPI0025C05EF5|nr:hypothetical protein [Clostridium sp.]MCH3965328.1 hypothetical protein [Clostridium sp.]MCI1714549.1 hypothetical protein [Clostridium sp.]MCI1798811.1 hypothetical protein [Clostridium sp.]MCI1812458.1 hypothetical protein [Clostridium sp.]MCI1869621.1 hypothetical protein [Clostridium sp.]
MSHKRKSEDRDQIENKDLGYYENRVTSLKKTVKQLEKIKRRKKQEAELERKRRKILRKIKKHH